MSTSDNGEIRYEIITEPYRDQVYFLCQKHFTLDEPLAVAMQQTERSNHQFFIDIIDENIREKNSYIAIDSATNTVVGFRSNSIKTRAEHTGKTSHKVDAGNADESMQPFILTMHYITALENGGDAFSQLPDAQKILKFNLVVVHRDFRRRGIAQRLIELTIEFARSQGCDYIITTATSDRTQVMFAKKFPFKVVNSLNLDDFKINGKAIAEPSNLLGQYLILKL